MKVAILGAGPSGMIAAHALMEMDDMEDPDVYTHPSGKSPIYGAQYLHMPIPGQPNMIDPMHIRYIMQGEPEQYLRKVYGNEWDGTINDELRTQSHLAWDMRATYDWLWDQYDGLVIPFVFSTETMMDSLAHLCATYDLVINTIPRNAFCIDGTHKFKSVRIYAIGDTEEHRCPFRAPEGQIIYNGTDEHRWYRASTIGGYSTLEYPYHGGKPPVDGVAGVAKPLGHNCSCLNHLPNLHHLGRMGRWQNGSLAHHVFPDIMEIVHIWREENDR